MFEDLILRMEVTEQKEPNHGFIQKVRTYNIEKPKDLDEILDSVKDIIHGDLDSESWPNNLWECDKRTAKAIDKAGLILKPFIGVVRIDISYGRRGFNHE